MAQYFTDFSEYTVGQVPADWTPRWGTDTTFTVIEDLTAANGVAAEFIVTGTSNVHRALSWDAVDADPARDNVEILVKFRSSAVDAHARRMRLLARGSEPLATRTGYVLGQSGNGIDPQARIVSYLSSNFTDLSSGSSITLAADEWGYVKALVSGTDLKTKIWKASEAEPSVWTREAIDNSITAAGWVGQFLYDGSSQNVMDFFAVGTGGDAAPTAPVASPLGRPKGFPEGTTSYSGSALVPSDGGVLYYTVSQSATKPSTAQIKLGQDSSGNPGADFGSVNVVYNGVYDISGVGLVEATAYYIHFFHENSAGDSAVTTTPQFTTFNTTVTAPTGTPSIGTTSNTIDTVTFSFTGATGVDGYQYRLDSGELFDIGIPNPLEHTITGLSAGLIAETPGLQVRGYNGGGVTSWSVAQPVYTDGHRKPPRILSSQVVSRIGDTTTISWEFN